MVVKVFKVFERCDRADNMRMQSRRGMSGERDVMSLAKRGNLEKTSDPAASSNVGLLHVYRSCREHPLKIKNVIAVLSCGNLHAGGCAIT
jgi:hypothetical protein